MWSALWIVVCLLPFFFWLLCCVTFFDLRILITPLISSNSSNCLILNHDVIATRKRLSHRQLDMHCIGKYICEFCLYHFYFEFVINRYIIVISDRQQWWLSTVCICHSQVILLSVLAKGNPSHHRKNNFA